MALTEQTAPTSEPLSTQDFKDYARIEDSWEDQLIDSWGVSARKKVERDTNRSLINTVWDWKLDDFPDDSDTPLYLPRAPVVSVTSVTYVDTAGDSQTWDSDEYTVDTDSEPGRIEPAYGYTWPSTRAQHNAITVRFTAGYGTDREDVEEDLLFAMKILVSTWHEHRTLIQAGRGLSEVPVPVAYVSLTFPHRVPLL